jgi:pilus assembly protein CpaD
MSKFNHGVRMAALAAALLAGSCASDGRHGFANTDGAENHPIVVEPSDKALELPFSANEAGLMPEDTARLESFVGDYLNSGSGAISVSAPDGPGSSAALSYFGERLALLGVPRERILVGTHPGSDSHVQIDFITYVAHTDKCGDWSANLAETESNSTAPNFGCSVQHNIAAMVTDPRDLMTPEQQTEGDVTQRTTMMGHFEQGTITTAQKSQSQNGSVSDVGTSGGGQ